MVIFSYELAGQDVHCLCITHDVDLDTFFILDILFADEDGLDIIPNVDTLVVMLFLCGLLSVSLVGKDLQTVTFSPDGFRSKGNSNLWKIACILQVQVE